MTETIDAAKLKKHMGKSSPNDLQTYLADFMKANGYEVVTSYSPQQAGQPEKKEISVEHLAQTAELLQENASRLEVILGGKDNPDIAYAHIAQRVNKSRSLPTAAKLGEWIAEWQVKDGPKAKKYAVDNEALIIKSIKEMDLSAIEPKPGQTPSLEYATAKFLSDTFGTTGPAGQTNLMKLVNATQPGGILSPEDIKGIFNGNILTTLGPKQAQIKGFVVGLDYKEAGESYSQWRPLAVNAAIDSATAGLKAKQASGEGGMITSAKIMGLEQSAKLLFGAGKTPQEILDTLTTSGDVDKATDADLGKLVDRSFAIATDLQKLGIMK
ncbi:MAG: hypothetical protein MRY32_06705 [Rickettsiales bacterium]|nr:hypothetical protein [Rickettsiales bacterium]